MPWNLRESVVVGRGGLQGFGFGLSPSRYYSVVLGSQVVNNAVALRAVMLELSVVEYPGSPGQLVVLQDKIVWAQGAVLRQSNPGFGTFMAVYIPKNAPAPQYVVGLAEFIP